MGHPEETGGPAPSEGEEPAQASRALAPSTQQSFLDPASSRPAPGLCMALEDGNLTLNAGSGLSVWEGRFANIKTLAT